MRSAGIIETLPWLERRWYEGTASREQAEAFCRRLAARHYENFPVVSFLLPPELRQDFANVYAFCRVADDLADELDSTEESLARLDEWRALLDACYHGRAAHPVFVALDRTIRRRDIPRQPFDDLLSAFRQDRFQTRYRTWEEVLDYCSRSANPVGRLVLHICGCRDESRHRLSDRTCTALQLANFWQDVSRDFERGRIYVPEELARRHRCSEAIVREKNCTPEWQNLMRDLVARTRALFAEGWELHRLLHGRVRRAVGLFSRGGLAVLQKIERAGYDTLTRRPQLTLRDRWRIVAAELLDRPPSGLIGT